MKKTVLLVSHDKKTVGQVSRWLKELPEEVLVEAASSLDELQQNFLIRTSDPEKKDFLRLLIFDVAMFGSSDPMPYISQTREAFQANGWVSSEAPLKIMILSFDNAAIPLRTFIHKDIDDLLMKPLDHQLFMQKSGMLLADKSKSAGSFLFKQKANFVVEMAKEVRIVKLSEFGVVISNPTPLAPGIFAHLYSSLFGDKTKSSVWGRVFSTRRDPKIPGNYLCFFTFFGIQPEQLMNYRRKLRERRKEIRHFDTGYDRNKIPGAIRHVAVIDRNSSNAQVVAETLSANYLNLKTYAYSSYAQFLKAVSGSAVPIISDQAEPVEGAAPVVAIEGGQITFFIAADGAALLRTEPEAQPESLFCGMKFEELKGNSKWLELLVSTDRDEWDEFLLMLERGHKAQAILYFKNVSGAMHAILVNGENAHTKDADKRTIQLMLRELNPEEIQMEHDRRHKEQAVFPQIDGIYIDALSFRDFPSWYEGIRELLKRANLLIGEKLPVCLMVDEDASVKPEDYRITGVADFIYKPVDRRFLAAKAAVLISDLVASNDDHVDLSFTPADIPGKIGKEVSLDEVAEFGFQVKSAIPLREDIFLRFFSPLFLDESGDGVLARCTSCTPNPNEKDSFGCFFTFFGVSDGQLKHIRNWIREDYVSKKDEAG